MVDFWHFSSFFLSGVLCMSLFYITECQTHLLTVYVLRMCIFHRFPPSHPVIYVYIVMLCACEFLSFSVHFVNFALHVVSSSMCVCFCVARFRIGQHACRWANPAKLEHQRVKGRLAVCVNVCARRTPCESQTCVVLANGTADTSRFLGGLAQWPHEAAQLGVWVVCWSGKLLCK